MLRNIGHHVNGTISAYDMKGPRSKNSRGLMLCGGAAGVAFHESHKERDKTSKQDDQRQEREHQREGHKKNNLELNHGDRLQRTGYKSQHSRSTGRELHAQRHFPSVRTSLTVSSRYSK